MKACDVLGVIRDTCNIIAILSVFLVSDQVFAETSLSSIAERDRNAILFISSEYQDAKTGIIQQGPTGTAFIVSENGYVLTATHLIKDWLGQTEEDKLKYPLYAQIASRNASEKIQLQVMAADLVGDYTLLKLRDSSKKYTPVQMCFEQYAHLTSGMPVFALGFPNRSDFTPVSGSFSNDNNPQGFFEAAAPFSPGMSGAPVYNNDGVVIGIVQGGYQQSSTTNFVIPLRWARSWLQDRTPAISACASNPSIAVPPVVAEAELCSRLKDIIKSAKVGFKTIMIGKKLVNDSINKPRIILPSARWCALNERPDFSRSTKSVIYYSCMMFSYEKDDRVASAKFSSYSDSIGKCLAPSWVLGDLEVRKDSMNRTLTRNQDSVTVELRLKKDSDGNDFVIYVEPE